MAHLPPTLNTLDPHDRMRLVRSNRKLEAVLGAAPYLLDEVDRTPSPSSSISSDSSEDGSFVLVKSPKRNVLSRPLLLRLRSAPVPINTRAPRRRSSRGVLSAIKATSPLSPTFAINLEMKQATPQPALPLDDRRRKMARITRTLGESVPPEAVFSSAPSVAGKRIVTPLMMPRQRKRMPFPLVSAEDDDESNALTTQSAVLASPSALHSTPELAHHRPSISHPRTLRRTHSPPNPKSSPFVTEPPATSRTGTPPPTPSCDIPGTTTTTPKVRRPPRPRSLSLGSVFPLLPHPSGSSTTRSPTAPPKRPIRPLPTLPPPAPPHHSPSHPHLHSNVHVDVSVSRSSHKFDPACSTHDTAHLRTTVSPPPRSSSRAGVDVKALKALDERPKGPAPLHQRRGEYQELVETTDTDRVVTRTVGGAGRRKEKDWSGEWNRTDMEEVIRALRALK